MAILPFGYFVKIEFFKNSSTESFGNKQTSNSIKNALSFSLDLDFISILVSFTRNWLFKKSNSWNFQFHNLENVSFRERDKMFKNKLLGILNILNLEKFETLYVKFGLHGNSV